MFLIGKDRHPACRYSVAPPAEVLIMPSLHVPPVNVKGTPVRTVDSKSKQSSELDVALPALDALSEELNRLAAINAELVCQLRGAAHAVPRASPAGAEHGELAALRQDNADLRQQIEQLESTLASQANED